MSRTYPEILKDGFLTTKSDRQVLGNEKKWVRHFFVLDSTTQHLSFFRGDKLVGQIALVPETEINLYHSAKHAFSLKTPFVSLFCQTQDDADRDQWVDRLHVALRANNTGTNNSNNNNSRSFHQPQQPTTTATSSFSSSSAKTGAATEAVVGAPKSSMPPPPSIAPSSSMPTTNNNRPVPQPSMYEAGKQHTFMANNTKFEIDSRYEFKRVLGQGAYGVVIAVRDHKTGTDVAIKKVQNVLDHPVDSKRMLREIQIMRFLNSKKVVTLYSLMKSDSESWETFTDVYLVMRLMDTDLHHILQSQQNLTDQHLQLLMFQLLSAVYYFETAKIVHRDLKPANILVNSACQLCVCDFGLSRALDQEVNTEPTIYVVTRWYRAPELLCGCTKYTSAIDIWSVGCIFAEMIARTALFPGKDYLDQLGKIMKIRGSFSPSDLAAYSKHSTLDEKTVELLGRFPDLPKVELNTLPGLANASPLALDLLDQLLTLNFERRVSAQQATQHPYLAQFNKGPLEVCHSVYRETKELDERVQHPKEIIRAAIVKEIKQFSNLSD